MIILAKAVAASRQGQKTMKKFQLLEVGGKPQRFQGNTTKLSRDGKTQSIVPPGRTRTGVTRGGRHHAPT